MRQRQRLLTSSEFPRHGGRLRVSTGVVFVAIALFLIFLFPAILKASTSSQTIKIGVVQNSQWSTALALDCSPTSSADCTYSVGNCLLSATTASLHPGAKKILDDFGLNQCVDSSGVGLAKIDITGDLDIRTISTFRSTLTASNVAVCSLPPITFTTPPTPSSSSYASTHSVIRNDSDFSASLALWNTGSNPVDITILSFDGSGTEVGGQSVTLPVGFSLIPITPIFSSGSVSILYGGTLGCANCNQSTSPFGGYAFLNWRSGGSPIVIPLDIHFSSFTP